MANPTTNYGWPMPTATDLVTDLPADFAAFGQPVDTSLKALNPETTLGDIAYRSATANTNTRLGIGSTGQVLTVTGGVPVWATPAGGGKILQVVQATSDTVTTSTSTSFADSNLSATITPSSASSKILVITSQMMRIFRTSTGMEANWQLVRGATAILTYDYATLNGIMSLNVAANTSGNLALSGIVPMSYLDSPATTSATTYKTQISAAFTTSSGSVTAQFGGLKSTIILMEVGA